jgi:hypothetical protein
MLDAHEPDEDVFVRRSEVEEALGLGRGKPAKKKRGKGGARKGR